MTSVLLPYRRPGTLYKLFADKPSLAMDTMVDPEVDTAKMSATAIICTPALDWDDEIILPEGVEWESRYKSNPVVMYEHGFIPDFALPIGKSESPDGQFTVRLAEGGIEATSYFTNKSYQSAQIFDLIVEKIVRASSIRVDPDESAARQEIKDTKRCTVYPKSSMVEWSWCAMGANPEALAKVLGRNRLAGSPIIESLAKSLRPMLPQRRLFTGGWSPEPEENDVTTTPTNPAKPEGDKAKSLKKDIGDAAAGAPLRDKGLEGGEAEEPALEDEGPKESPSAQVLGAIHSSLQGLLSNIAAAANTYENPDAISFVNDTLVPVLTDLAGQVDAAYSACSGGKSMAPESGDQEPPDEDVMKSWLAGNRSRGLQLGGYASRLQLLATAKNLQPDQRLTVTGIVKHLRDLTAKARTEVKPVASSEVSDETLQKLANTSAVFKSLAADLKALVPAQGA